MSTAGGPPASHLLRRALESRAPRAAILIRLAAGVVFTAEGIQKFLYPAALGAGRFARIGLPAPEILGPFVGAVEIASGALVLAGLFTRLAAIPLIAVMLVAIVSTKIPILLGHGYWMFANPTVSKHGVWSTLHEARTDLSMLLASLFLLLAGAGPWSLDAVLGRRSGTTRQGDSS